MYNYLIIVFIFLVLDLIWIKLYMGKKYINLVKNIQNSSLKINFTSAFFAYILIASGIIMFAYPRIRKDSKYILKDSLYYGFLYGFILYGVYDLTCGAIFKNWDFKLAIIDMLWGGLATFLSLYVGIKLYNKFFNK